MAERSRADWLDWRRQGIGASDIAGILGISPWASPWSVWADKVGLTPEKPDDGYLEFGRRAEVMIGPWFTDLTGLGVAGEQMWCVHKTQSVFRCTLDGLVVDRQADHDAFTYANIGSAIGGLEIKTTGPGKKWDDLPPHYQAQGQWQMLVTGTDQVWFAVLMGRRLDIHELQRDRSDIDLMAKRAREFWETHVVTGSAPPTDGHQATLDALAAVYPGAEPEETVELGEAEANLIADLQSAKAEAKLAKSRATEAEAALKARLGDATVGIIGDRKAVTWRKQRREAHHVEASEFRVLRVAS